MSPENAQPLIPSIEIRYAGIQEITIYFVSDDELRVLERGGTSSTVLNLAIFFMSVGASFLASLLLSPPPSIRTFTVMVWRFLLEDSTTIGFFNSATRQSRCQMS